MHHILDLSNFIWAIKACVDFFDFCHQNKTFRKLSETLFILPKKLLLSSSLSNFCTSLFPSFFPFLAVAGFIEVDL